MDGHLGPGRPSRRPDLFQVVVVHHPEDEGAARDLARRLDHRGVAVLRMTEGVSDRQLEQILAGAPRVAVAVGRRAPWEEQRLLSWLKLFLRRQCALVPVRFPESRVDPALPGDPVLEPWLELGAGGSGLERLTEPRAVPAEVPPAGPARQARWTAAQSDRRPGRTWGLAFPRWSFFVPDGTKRGR